MHDENHGYSPAAWTGVAIMLVAATVACYAAVFGPASLMWIGIAVFVAGSLVWYAMAKAGLGSDGPRARARRQAQTGR